MIARPDDEADTVTVVVSRDTALVLYGILCRFFVCGDLSVADGGENMPSGEFWALSDVQVQLETAFITLAQQNALIAEASNRLAAKHNQGNNGEAPS